MVLLSNNSQTRGYGFVDAPYARLTPQLHTRQFDNFDCCLKSTMFHNYYDLNEISIAHEPQRNQKLQLVDFE